MGMVLLAYINVCHDHTSNEIKKNSFTAIITESEGVKHNTWGPESDRQRLKSAPLDSFGKCEGGINVGLLF